MKAMMRPRTPARPRLTRSRLTRALERAAQAALLRGWAHLGAALPPGPMARLGLALAASGLSHHGSPVTLPGLAHGRSA